MADTTDKPAAPGESTDEENVDKGTGQADEGTGESQDGSKPSDDNASGSGESQEETDAEESEDATDTEEESDQESEDDESEDEDEEPQLLTPQEIEKLPSELKKQYKAMQGTFTKKMQTAAALVKQARAILRGEKPDGTDTEGSDTGDRTVTSVVESVLQRRGIDPNKLSKQVRAELDLVAEIALEGAGHKANEAVAPLITREAKAEVDSYFKQHPDRAKYRKAMGRKDTATRGTLTMDELYYAVAGKDLEGQATERKDKKLRNLSKGNAESGAGQPGSQGKEGDVFDEIAAAGGHDNTILL